MSQKQCDDNQDQTTQEQCYNAFTPQYQMKNDIPTIEDYALIQYVQV